LPSADLEKLRSRGLRKLSTAERYTLATAVQAGFAAGSVSANDVLGSMPAFAADPERMLATQPMEFLRSLRNHWLSDAERPALETFVKQLYLPLKNRLGFREQKGESGEIKLLRAQLLAFVADVGNDEPTRTRLSRMGKQYLGIGADSQLHPELVPNDLADAAVRLLVQTGDDALFDVVYQRFKQTEDAVQRARYLRALGSVRDARSPRALALTFDAALRVNEVLIPLREQLAEPRTREAAYAFFEQTFEALEKRLSPPMLANTPFLAPTCDQAMITRVQAFFGPRIAKLPGGPRSLEGAIEALRLCDALIKAQGEAVRAFFKRR
jgi:alanyl aminopeptidase